MPAVGLLLLLAGCFLISSAIQGRKPKDTVLAVIREPSSARELWDESAGTVPLSGPAVPTTAPTTGTGIGTDTDTDTDKSATPKAPRTTSNDKTDKRVYRA